MSQNFNGPVTVDGNEIFTKPASGIAKSDLASDVQTSLGKADTALQSFTETDPTVPSWAKAANKPTYTYSEVGAAASSHTHTKSQITDFPILATVATSGSYNDLSNKPTIPAAVTENTVSGWGFTKNTGTVSSLGDLGITATATELSYTKGVTSSIQTQLNSKLGTSAKAADSDKLDGNDSSYFATASALAAKLSKVAASTDNAIVKFSGTTGDIQNSGITISSNNDLYFGTDSSYRNIIENGEGLGLSQYYTNSSTGRIDRYATLCIDAITIRPTWYFHNESIDIGTNLALLTDIPSIWKGTQAEYDALGTYDNNTLYFIQES